MRETGILFLFLIFCLMISALLIYPLMATGWLEFEPHKVMGRLAMLIALFGIWPLLAWMGVANRSALGYNTPRSRFLSTLWQGWALGVLMLLPLVLTLLLLGVQVSDIAGKDWLGELPGKLIQVLLGGLLTSLIEETFFRGALYSAIRRTGGVAKAALWSSALYAFLHFMKPHALPDGMPLDWSGAWHMFVHTFTDAFQWQHLDSMIALMLAGVFLSLVRERSGHIGWCLGLHAGWIFVIQLTRHLADVDPASSSAWLVGDYDGVIGWLAAAWVGLVTLGFWLSTASRWRGLSANAPDTRR